MPTVEIPITVSPSARIRLLEILQSFEQACSVVRQAALTHHTRHQAALHNHCYRLLCHERGLGGIPAQYAIRAISRVSHQLRAAHQGFPDPYPDHSFDLDSHCASIDWNQGMVYLSTLDCRGLRGRAAQLARLALPAQLPQDLADAHLAGATLVIPPNGRPHLLASLA